MSSYENSAHTGRLVIVPRVRDAFADLYVSNKPRGATPTLLVATQPPIELFQVNEFGSKNGERDVYNFPVLFHRCGLPWIEANSYLLNLVKNKHARTRPTDKARRTASRLLDYLLFCEDQEIDWKDFSGKRPPLRPTYRYFRHLIDDGGKSPAVINQYTNIVYDFIKFVSLNWHYEIDMERVDTVKKVRLLLESGRGARMIEVEKRSQTLPTSKESNVPIGFVRDDGEDLRPLTNEQLSELLAIIDDERNWSQQERLILLVALMTGARKQTVLTLRMKHLEGFTEDNLHRDKTYHLHVGPGTGIDTKRDKPQMLHVPKQLADDLKVFASSPMAVKRRGLLREKLKKEHSSLEALNDDDLYVSLSDQGTCYYMAESDPRYLEVKSRPTGQVTETIKRKLIKYASKEFPLGFTYHWLRATFAFQLYQHLLPLLASGRLQYGEEGSLVQRRLYHSNRETTENYLKLFRLHSDKLAAQELYEDEIFGFGDYSDLRLESANE